MGCLNNREPEYPGSRGRQEGTEITIEHRYLWAFTRSQRACTLFLVLLLSLVPSVAENPLIETILGDTAISEDTMLLRILDGAFTDTAGRPLEYSATSMYSSMSVSISGDTLTAVPTADWTGINLIYVTATTREGASNTQSFSLQVDPVNDAPWFERIPPEAGFHHNALCTLDLSPYARDIDSPSRTLAVIADSISGLWTQTDNLILVLWAQTKLPPLRQRLRLYDGQDTGNAIEMSVDPDRPVAPGLFFPLFHARFPAPAPPHALVPDHKGGVFLFSLRDDRLSLEHLTADGRQTAPPRTRDLNWGPGVTGLAAFAFGSRFFLAFKIPQGDLDESYRLAVFDSTLALERDTAVNLGLVKAMQPDTARGSVFFMHNIMRAPSLPAEIFLEAFDLGLRHTSSARLLDSVSLGNQRVFKQVMIPHEQRLDACWIQSITDTAQTQAIFCAAWSYENRSAAAPIRLPISHRLDPENYPHDEIQWFGLLGQGEDMVLVWNQQDFLATYCDNLPLRSCGRSNPKEGNRIFYTRVRPDYSLKEPIRQVAVPAGFNRSLRSFIATPGGYFLSWEAGSGMYPFPVTFTTARFDTGLAPIDVPMQVESIREDRTTWPLHLHIFGNTLLARETDEHGRMMAAFQELETPPVKTKATERPETLEPGPLPAFSLSAPGSRVLFNPSDKAIAAEVRCARGRLLAEISLAPGSNRVDLGQFPPGRVWIRLRWPAAP